MVQRLLDLWLCIRMGVNTSPYRVIATRYEKTSRFSVHLLSPFRPRQVRVVSSKVGVPAGVSVTQADFRCPFRAWVWCANGNV